jgi:hypothetical protein
MGRKGLSYFNFIGLAYQGKHIVFRFNIKYFKGFWPLCSRSILIQGYLKDEIFACVET